jgi:hypothetical protein
MDVPTPNETKYPLWYTQHLSAAIQELNAISGVEFPSSSYIIDRLVDCWDSLNADYYPNAGVRQGVAENLVDVIAFLRGELDNLDEFLEEASAASNLIAHLGFTVGAGKYGLPDPAKVAHLKKQLYSIITYLNMVRAKLLGSGTNPSVGEEMKTFVKTTKRKQ